MVSFVLPLSSDRDSPVCRRLGKDSFEGWLEKLDSTTFARITVLLDRVERGNFSSAKGVGGIYELRLDFGPGYRIYFGKDGETLVILLAGGTKKRQSDDIERAKVLWQEYKRRKREGRHGTDKKL